MSDTLQHWVVYLSPAGTTRHVAEVIHESLVSRGQSSRLLDLGSGELRGRIGQVAADAPESLCLWLGSPVYVDHAVPLLHEFIAAVPPGTRRLAVPFVTWGGVTSGLALPELAVAFDARGFAVLGAAKIMAVHSSMWGSRQPLGQGHPDAADDALTRGLVATVLDKLAGPAPAPVDTAQLDYLPPDFRSQAAAKSLALAKTMMPAPRADPERCTRCGQCATDCPVGAIELAPLPAMNDACIRCQGCVRGCPSQAFPHDPAAIEVRLQDMAAASPEAKETAVFY